MWRSVLNFILFYVGWFACVVGMTPLGARWWGPAAALVIVAVHLAVQSDRRRELRAIGLSLAIGPLCDTALMALGVIRFAEPPLLQVLPPLSMIALWAVFATTFHSSFAWLARRPLALVPFSLVGAPLSYLWGERIGAVAFAPSLPVALLAIAIAWALVLPALVWLILRAGPEAATATPAAAEAAPATARPG
jgi:hypothetical protein